jgi:hypothetical protein
MFDQSVIRKTGQWWKGQLASFCVFGGGVVMLYGISNSLLPAIFSGMAAVAVGFVFACASIRCPFCGARWVWLGVNGQHSGQWFPWLMAQSTCPSCKK